MTYLVAKVKTIEQCDSRFAPTGNKVISYDLFSETYDTKDEAKAAIQEKAAPCFANGIEKLVILIPIYEAVPPSVDIQQIVACNPVPPGPELLTEEEDEVPF